MSGLLGKLDGTEMRREHLCCSSETLYPGYRVDHEEHPSKDDCLSPVSLGPPVEHVCRIYRLCYDRWPSSDVIEVWFEAFPRRRSLIEDLIGLRAVEVLDRVDHGKETGDPIFMSIWCTAILVSMTMGSILCR